MKVKFLFMVFVVFNIVFLTNGEEILQNTAGLCKSMCSCSNSTEEFIVDCHKQNIQNTLAKWPILHENITTLIGIFSYNHVDRLEKMAPTNATSVVISYDHCNITQLATGLFENIIQIKSVDLSYNFIKADQLQTDVFKGPYNNSVYEPINLESLNLAHNQIHSLNKNIFEHLPNLRILNLEGNNFKLFDHQTALAFQNLKKLQFLNLARNRFYSIPHDVLKPLKNLISLDVSNNILELVPSAIKELTNSLRYLSIDGNPIGEFLDTTFLGMEMIIEISATNLHSVKRIKTNSFLPLKKLKKIDLSGLSSLVTVEDKAFGDINSVEMLNLSNSNLQTLPIHLIDWGTLKSLDLRNNKFYCECNFIAIISNISEEIKRDRNGPFCYDGKKYRQFQMYSIDKNLCFEEDEYNTFFNRKDVHKTKVLRISLIILCIILSIAGIIAVWFTYKQLTQRRHFSSINSVIYNPLGIRT